MTFAEVTAFQLSLPLQQSQDYETALAQKEALLAELHSENLSQSTENHRLRRDLKKVTQELSELRQERERLAQALEEARGEKSEGDRAIHVSPLGAPCMWLQVA